jgi:hypothetical protein
VGGDGGNRRRTAFVVAGLVAVVGLGLVLGDGGDGGGEEAAASTTTTRRRATTTSTSSTTTLPAGPVLPVQTGASLLLANSSTTWTMLDLDTGTRSEVEIQSRDPYSAVPVSGGIVALRGDRAEYLPLLGPSAGVPVELGRADQVLASGRPDRVWLALFDDDGPFGSGGRAVLVDLSGDRIGGELHAPAGYLQSATPSGLVFVAGGRIFVVDEDGVRLLGIGEILMSSGEALVLQSCDERARCGPVLIDTTTGASTSLAGMGTPFGISYGFISLADDRIAFAGGGGGPEGPATITIADRSGRVLGSVPMLDLRGEPAWLPDGQGLVVPAGNGLVRISEQGGGLVAEPVAGLRRFEPVERVLVIRP